MKRTLFTLFLAGITTSIFAQTKSSGNVVLSTATGYGLTVKVDLNQSTSVVTITMTGPSDKWFALGLNAYTMSANTDCITSGGTSVLDQYLPGGHNQPITDPTNNLTVSSNTVGGLNRTIVVTRPFNTSDTHDYTFTSALTSLNIIWAIGPSTTLSAQHDIYGSDTLTFTTLGTDDFSILEQSLKLYPNPSKGIFKVSRGGADLSKIKVFDINGKLVREINSDLNNSDIQIDLSGVGKGIYFLELSNGSDKAVKKIQIN